MLLLLAVAAVLLWFGALEYRELFHPDEGRYAEIPREMVATGDWVVPHLNGVPYLEKPPLQYWATAAAIAVLGGDEWTARLWPALTGFLGVLAVLFAGRRLFGRREGLLAAALLASSFLYVVMSQVLTLDMGLTFFLGAAVFCFLFAQREGKGTRQERAWMLGAWAAMALAVLSKGLIGVVLPALVLAAYIAVERDIAVLRRLHLLPGTALLLVLTLPWFVAVQWSEPDFFNFFFLHEHFDRFTQPGHHRPGSWYYFIGIFAAGALPWTALYVAALVRALRSDAGGASTFNAARFLALFAVVVLVFFSFSSSKLPAYILPMFPPLALLGGRELAARGRRGASLLLVSLALFALLLPAVFGLLPHVPRLFEIGDELRRYLPWLAAASALALAAAVVGWRLLERRRRLHAIALAAVALLGTQVLLINGTQEFAQHFSTKRLLEGIERRFEGPDAAAPFFSVELYDQTIPLNLGRPVIVVAHRDELDEGLKTNPAAALPDIESFRRAWSEAPQAYAVMKHPRYLAERAGGLPMTVLAQDSRYVVVAKVDPGPNRTSRRSGVW